MKTILILDFLLLSFALFFIWLFPEIGNKSRQKCEEWWLTFSDIDHTKIGSLVARLITRRIDTVTGNNFISSKYLLISFILANTFFIALLFIIIILWDTTSSIESATNVLIQLFLNIGHLLPVLLILNAIFNMISFLATRIILRYASKTSEPRDYLKYILLDLLVALTLVFLSIVLFTNLYFSIDKILGFLIFLLYLGFIPLFLGTLVYIPWLVMLLIGKVEDEINFSNMILPICVPGGSILLADSLVQNNFYISYLSLNFNDVSIVLLLCVAMTAVIPTLVNIMTVGCIFTIRLFSGPTHNIISRVLLRLAETSRGFLFGIAVILFFIKDLTTILLIK